jgi:hypothetical protein
LRNEPCKFGISNRGGYTARPLAPATTIPSLDLVVLIPVAASFGDARRLEPFVELTGDYACLGVQVSF